MVIKNTPRAIGECFCLEEVFLDGLFWEMKFCFFGFEEMVRDFVFDVT